MTKKAIELLDGDRDGFFLQVEGASIDKQDHAANACGQIGEMIEFDNTIAVAQAYARKHPDTLILVTADHAHTSQIVAEDSNPTGTTPNNSPTGYSNNLITADDQIMRVTYGTAGGAASPGGSAEPAAHGLGGPGLGPGPGRVGCGRYQRPHRPVRRHRRRVRSRRPPLAASAQGPAHGRAGPLCAPTRPLCLCNA